MDVGALIRHLPADGLHLLCIAGINFDLARLRVQHRVAAEEFLPHLLFHKHAVAVKFLAHHAAGGDRNEVRLVHHLRHMVAGNAPPMADAGRTVLVAARIAAIRIALRMPDEDRNIRVKHVFVHDHMVARLGISKVYQVIVVFAVMAGDLPERIKLIKQLLAEDRAHLLHRCTRVQSVGKQQEHILLLHADAVKLVEAGADRHLAVRGRLVAALYDIRNDDDNLIARLRNFRKRWHPDRIADTLHSRLIKAVPVLRKTRRIGNRFAGYKNICGIRQFGAHHAIAILKL